MSVETREMKEIEAAVEGILFASGEPVAVDRICVALNMDRPTVELVLQHLQDYYSYERRGVRLLRMEDSWQLCSAPEYGDQIRKAFEIRKPAKLSQPALEVLTIIAYYQPTTRAYVDQIRGVDSSYTVGLLLDRHLIEECGRLQVPGRPRLYRTTQAFLRAFHLNSLEELPQREREVLLLRYYKGLTQTRAARVLGVSQVQVSRLERRAVERLRQMLAPEGGQAPPDG